MRLEMGFKSILDSKGNKDIDIDANSRENYKLTVMLNPAVEGQN